MDRRDKEEPAGGTVFSGNVAALDPGRDKCGFAILAADGKVLLQRVIETKHLEAEVEKAWQTPGFSCLIEGNGTTSKAARTRIRQLLPTLKISVVDEYRTTEMAKKAYWRAHPPKGLFRLIPTTMRVPPVPVDDYVAVILARRALGLNSME